MTVEKALVRAEDLLRPPLSEKRCELVEGVVVEMAPPGGRHSDVAVQFIGRFWQYASRHGGRPLGEVGIITAQDPDTVRAPDAGFFTAGRAGTQSPSGYLQTVPDVVVEVISPNDRAREVLDKVTMWLAKGARLVWVAYPESGRVVEYRPDGESRVLVGDDLLDGGDVLPGFSARVRDVLG